MNPRCLVYILAAIVVAFVFRGYFAAEEVQSIMHEAATGNVEAITCSNACGTIDRFQTYLLCSGALAVVMAICCKLKAPK